MPDRYIKGILENLEESKLTDSRKMLMFTYKVQFERVRQAADLS